MNVGSPVLRIVSVAETASPAELIERTLAGDGSAFGELVQRFQKKIFRIALAIVRDEMEAEVITQDTFLQAYRKLSGFEGRAEFETWLTRIAINRSRDSLRRRKWSGFLYPGGPDDAVSIDPVDPRPSAERVAMSRQLNDAIEHAVETLSAMQKTVFRLRHYEELSLEEIAVTMGIRPGTARAHLFRAVHKIREQLGDWFVERTPAGGIQR